MNCDKIEVETVDEIINKLTRGKAAGLDNLTCEHLQYCHPVVISCLTMLFNLMIGYGYVPNAFGEGIIIPIPKGDSKRMHDKIDDYRGITISSLISKIFEQCLLCCNKDYFQTSERQFGFKKGVGCNHALYTLRQVIDYYSKNNSTVNICTLDISKAFD